MSAVAQTRLLSPDAIAAALPTLKGWAVEGINLTKRMKYVNFVDALAYVNRLGTLAEAANHHPDIQFGWGYVTILLTTHDAGGITANDVAMAAKIDELG
jgi:4a-hydroxytetrahydrobiopterin dehydratase